MSEDTNSDKPLTEMLEKYYPELSTAAADGQKATVNEYVPPKPDPEPTIPNNEELADAPQAKVDPVEGVAQPKG